MRQLTGCHRGLLDLLRAVRQRRADWSPLIRGRGLVSPGRTSHVGVHADDDLLVQLYLDVGDGPAMVRVPLDPGPGG